MSSYNYHRISLLIMDIHDRENEKEKMKMESLRVILLSSPGNTFLEQRGRQIEGEREGERIRKRERETELEHNKYCCV